MPRKGLLSENGLKQVSIKEVREGSILATNIHSKGKTLFRRGHKLLRRDITFLRNAGLRAIPIADADSDTFKTGTISEETREEAVTVVTNVLNDFENLNPKKYEAVRNVADKMVDEILQSKDLKIQAHDLRTYDEYTYRHSVNVTAISVAIARLMHWDARDLRTLAAGALVHDIGKMKIPYEVLRKEARLDVEERRIIEQHTVWGFDLLSSRNVGSPHEWAVTRQHHETLDGRGYPDGRMGDEMHPWAKIVAVADIWDALRSNRPYKQGWPSDRVLKLLNSDEMREKLDPASLEVMNQIAVPYTHGTQVKLSNGEIAVVVEQNPVNPFLPVVRVIRDGAGKELNGDGPVYSLQKEYEIDIVETVIGG